LHWKEDTPMKLLALLQTKAAVTIVASVLLVGGATAAFAATPAGQTVVQSFTHTHPTVTAAATHGSDSDQNGSAQGQKACPGLSDAQQLATSYHLSTANDGASMTAICALHKGTFSAMTTSGVKVTASRVYGYGEINQLLTLAQYMASHESTNTGGALSDTTVGSLLADALHTCGSMPLERCLIKNIPGFTPGNGQKPTATPNGNKPATTATPNGNRPTGTPTPHH
jgi:hypothetical protein